MPVTPDLNNGFLDSLVSVRLRFHKTGGFAQLYIEENSIKESIEPDFDF
jgi:hypothetical protein